MGFFNSSSKDDRVRQAYNGDDRVNDTATDDALRSSYSAKNHSAPVVDVEFHETSTEPAPSFTTPAQKRAEAAHAQQPTNGKVGETFFAKDVVISGTLNCSTDVVIEGTFEGPIHTAGDVRVRNGGIVKGDISANSVALNNATIEGNIEATTATINGKLKGNLMVNGVTFDEKAEFDGDVSTQGLEVRNGATVHGKIDVRGDDKPSQNVVREPQNKNSGNTNPNNGGQKQHDVSMKNPNQKN